MCTRNRWRLVGFVVCGAIAFAPAAWAQAAAVMPSAFDISVGVTVNGLLNDVNSAPACADLGLPCTHEHPEKVSGFGGNATVARNLTPHLAIAGDLSVFADHWIERESPLTTRRKVSYVSSIAAGPRCSTGFFDPGNGDRSPGRFFAQVLVGAESSHVVAARPLVILGAGADVLFPRQASGGMGPPSRAPGLRLALDYRLTPGAGRNFSGWRFVAAIVIGPRAS